MLQSIKCLIVLSIAAPEITWNFNKPYTGKYKIIIHKTKQKTKSSLRMYSCQELCFQLLLWVQHDMPRMCFKSQFNSGFQVNVLSHLVWYGAVCMLAWNNFSPGKANQYIHFVYQYFFTSKLGFVSPAINCRVFNVESNQNISYSFLSGDAACL